jgi:hypothetical protein
MRGVVLQVSIIVRIIVQPTIRIVRVAMESVSKIVKGHARVGGGKVLSEIQVGGL